MEFHFEARYPDVHQVFYSKSTRAYTAARVKLYRRIILNPSSPPFVKGRNSPLWQRGDGGDFVRICLVNYGLLGNKEI